ncbi:MAG: transcriptional regulator FilR1 domain-containing protein [Candidatus Bathyarchaeia archaeon]|jgi:predicted transcriptional regulator
MEKVEGIEKLFFDLASESRLGIIRELKEQNLKNNELGGKLDLTATETFRQLQHLTESLIVQRLPDGTYTITNYGKLTLRLLQSIEFTFKHKEYFLNHDVWRLPYQFVNRIGELSESTLCMDTIENINRAGHIVNEAEKYAWLMGEETLESISPMMPGQISKGVKFRLMFYEYLLPNFNHPGEAPYVEKRTLTDFPITIVCTEKEAGICFPSTEGRMDYAAFRSKDQMFVNWARELFLYYWDKGKPCHPT